MSKKFKDKAHRDTKSRFNELDESVEINDKLNEIDVNGKEQSDNVVKNSIEKRLKEIEEEYKKSKELADKKSKVSNVQKDVEALLMLKSKTTPTKKPVTKKPVTKKPVTKKTPTKEINESLKMKKIIDEKVKELVEKQISIIESGENKVEKEKFIKKVELVEAKKLEEQRIKDAELLESKKLEEEIIEEAKLEAKKLEEKIIEEAKLEELIIEEAKLAEVKKLEEQRIKEAELLKAKKLKEEKAREKEILKSQKLDVFTIKSQALAKKLANEQAREIVEARLAKLEDEYTKVKKISEDNVMEALENKVTNDESAIKIERDADYRASRLTREQILTKEIEDRAVRQIEEEWPETESWLENIRRKYNSPKSKEEKSETEIWLDKNKDSNREIYIKPEPEPLKRYKKPEPEHFEEEYRTLDENNWLRDIQRERQVSKKQSLVNVDEDYSEIERIADKRARELEEHNESTLETRRLRELEEHNESTLESERVEEAFERGDFDQTLESKIEETIELKIDEIINGKFSMQDVLRTQQEDGTMEAEMVLRQNENEYNSNNGDEYSNFAVKDKDLEKERISSIKNNHRQTINWRKSKKQWN